jgi:hypothetical protein
MAIIQPRTVFRVPVKSFPFVTDAGLIVMLSGASSDRMCQSRLELTGAVQVMNADTFSMEPGTRIFEGDGGRCSVL